MPCEHGIFPLQNWTNWFQKCQDLLQAVQIFCVFYVHKMTAIFGIDFAHYIDAS